MSYLPLIDLKNGFWPVVHLLYGISEWNFTDMLNIKGYIFLVRTVTLTFPVHELSALDWSEKWFLTCSSFTIWSIWMKLHRYVDHQRLHIVTKDVISLSISVLLLFRHYISHKITFGAPSSGGVLRSACGAFIEKTYLIVIKDETGLKSKLNASSLILIGSYVRKLVASYLKRGDNSILAKIGIVKNEFRNDFCSFRTLFFHKLFYFLKFI